MAGKEGQGVRHSVAASGPARGPVWRALLEAQWRARLQQVTELSLAYHEAAAAAAGRPGDGRPGGARPDEQNLRQLLRSAVVARRALADTDEALGRLASGRYGLCEGCAAAIAPRLLAAAPDLRYCRRCRRAGPGRQPGLTAAIVGTN
jgi:RNA polymerase-binding transcription factor DksA